ncbi:Unknown protein [Striga hermonthica]|uniref:CCHC-type domain-containing protein n=1 Tax=Striga hermonthica TaxID=68872 RepID=A0A9N7N390_STRHE|nr:Unknown protein [Striga hermonthica]
MSFTTTATRHSSSKSSRSSRQCNICGRSGHDATICFRVKLCPHCNRTGHDSRRCYEIVGYPPRWSGSSKTTPTCSSLTTQGNNTSVSSAGHGRGSISSNSAKVHVAGVIGTIGSDLVGPVLLILLSILALTGLTQSQHLQFPFSAPPAYEFDYVPLHSSTPWPTTDDSSSSTHDSALVNSLDPASSSLSRDTEVRGVLTLWSLLSSWDVATGRSFLPSDYEIMSPTLL